MSLCLVDLRQSLAPEPEREHAAVSVSMDYVTVTVNSYYLSQIVRCPPSGKVSLHPCPHLTSRRDKCSYSPVGRGSNEAHTERFLSHPLGPRLCQRKSCSLWFENIPSGVKPSLEPVSLQPKARRKERNGFLM